jgi:cytochrome c oxidase assembly factor CtaG
VDPTIDPLSPARLFTLWRPDAVVVTAVVVAAVGYLLAVRHLRRRGDGWPVSRVLAMMAGLATMLFALCGGPGSYASAILSMNTAQLLTMATVVPVLVNLGAPTQLIRTVSGSAGQDGQGGAVGHGLADPVNAAMLLTALLVGVYASPLLDLALRNALAHLLLNLAALAVGMLLFRALLGQDGATVTRSAADRAVSLAVVSGLLVVMAFMVWRAQAGYGSAWFADLNLWWAEPEADRRNTAVVMVGFAAPMLAIAVHLVRRPTLRPLPGQ